MFEIISSWIVYFFITEMLLNRTSLELIVAINNSKTNRCEKNVSILQHNFLLDIYILYPVLLYILKIHKRKNFKKENVNTAGIIKHIFI